MKKSIIIIILITLVLFLASCRKKEVDVTVNYDLTACDKVIAYSYASNMINDPHTYKGKTIKIEGVYKTGKISNNTYHFIVIKDATLCCEVALEIVYDKTYPKENTKIEVKGKYDSYKEDGKSYYCIFISEMNETE